MSRNLPALLVLGLSLSLMAMTAARAQSVEQFYKGRSITHARRDGARRHQRHFGAPGRQVSRPIRPRQSGRCGAEQSGRWRAHHRQQALQQRGAGRHGSGKIRARGAAATDPRRSQRAVRFATKFAWLGSMSSYGNDAYFLLVNANGRVKEHRASCAGGGVPINARLRQFCIQQLHLRGHRQRSARPQRQRDPRLHRRRQPLFLAMQTGELDGQYSGPELGAQRPAPPLEQGRVPAPDGVRPHHPASGLSGYSDRPRDDPGPQGAGADRLRRAAVLHGATVRGAARHSRPTAPRLCKPRSWTCAAIRNSWPRPRRSAST